MCQICMGYSNILIYVSEIIRSQLLYFILVIGILKLIAIGYSVKVH